MAARMTALAVAMVCLGQNAWAEDKSKTDEPQSASKKQQLNFSYSNGEIKLSTAEPTEPSVASEKTTESKDTTKSPAAVGPVAPEKEPDKIAESQPTTSPSAPPASPTTEQQPTTPTPGTSTLPSSPGTEQRTFYEVSDPDKDTLIVSSENKCLGIVAKSGELKDCQADATTVVKIEAGKEATITSKGRCVATADTAGHLHVCTFSPGQSNE